MKMKGEIIDENACALILCIIKNTDRETALQKCGVEVALQKKPANRPLSISEDEQDIIYDYYYNENMSLRSISKIYNVSKPTVRNFMLRVGIPIKPKGVRYDG